ncbi:glycoside hydrolase family 20 protein [Lutibacter sp. A64]|uniref:glycoside hydrolase family 20 protein n=1 Tax=Lutibacter sp. A64 TaxID=2918526 RepID=UPI001F05AE64|nr:family 20 glycosylhydrolase [Lutibacter sp. A64]UMB55273.1 glycoside hydrolase family 20 protein [Lutibacter sp. A64]
MKLIKTFLLVLLLAAIASCSKPKVFVESDIHIIPKPMELDLQQGVFEFTENTQIVVTNAFQKEIAKQFSDKIGLAIGFNLQIIEEVPSENYIQFLTNSELENEAYQLSINSNKIIVSASSNNGFLYGLETLKQLLPVEIESKELVSTIDWIVPAVEIKDQPRFKYRGLHLDVSRHFFKKEYIKKTIDRLTMHKMNVLHLHLVDDQGWRIEIKKYPKLTEVGAFRLDQEDLHWDARRVTTAEDEATYGGFYTQEDIKEIVAYATANGIEVIPEIEMPAHVMSAIASYPELSCFETPIGVPSGGVWPITEIYCAGKENTFEFLENVLLEVMELFPSKYIHIGGDEATKTNWTKCPHCQKRMQTEGLENVEELQSYFVKRMEKFINSKGKNLIGWDEILEGGLAPRATVMSWRGVKGGVEAAKQGHDVIMTPGSHCYFDHYQGPQNEEPLAWGGYTTLSKVYEFDPIVEDLTEDETKHILGGQANLWAEQIKTEAHSEYMIFPRLAALSETLWSPKESRNWEDFSNRITTMFTRYEFLGINYARSAYLVTADTQINLEENTVEVILKNEFPNSDIRYTLDGTDLNSSSNKYVEPIKITETTNLKASLFENNKPIGKEFNQIIKFHRAVGKKVSYKEIYNNNYKGAGDFTLVNTLRGTKNFHDGQWQAWLGKDMEVVIDLEKETSISNVIVGSMENQGPGIYYPTKIEVFVSLNGENYKQVGSVERAYAKNATSELKEFKIEFSTEKAQFVKVIATNLKQTPEGGETWLFIDEILID